MYAVVHTGGKQYRVRKGDTFRFEKLPGDIGSSVAFDRVMMLRNGDEVRIGQPVLDNVTVEGTIVEQDRAKKVIVFKYKRRKRYRLKRGHRQYYTAVRIDRILADGVDITATSDAQDQLAQKAEVETVTPEEVASQGDDAAQEPAEE